MKPLIKTTLLFSLFFLLTSLPKSLLAQSARQASTDSIQAALADVNVSEILITELGNAARESESIAKKFGIKITPGSGEAAAIGAQMAARTLKEEMYQTVAEVGRALPAVKAMIRSTILQGRNGKIVKAYDGKGFSVLSGVMGSGFFNMNPAVIIAILKPAKTGATIVLLKGYAKEGMIKQHSAQKAVQKIMTAINGAF